MGEKSKDVKNRANKAQALKGQKKMALPRAVPLNPLSEVPAQGAGQLAFRIVGAYLAVGLTFLLVISRGAPFFHNSDTHWQLSMSQIATFLILTAGFVFVLARHIFRELINARQAAARAKLELVHRLAAIAEWKDGAIGGHNFRIARSAHILASCLGLSEKHCYLIFHGAVLHDIGKVGMPDELIHKTGRFTPEERKQMEQHVILGAALLEGSKDELLSVARIIALNHHENYDGTGYPNRLRGKDIPIEGRIVAICDVLDALMSRRPYKDPWEENEAVQYILDERGRKFDPEIVDALLENLNAVLAVREETPIDPWAFRAGEGLLNSDDSDTELAFGL